MQHWWYGFFLACLSAPTGLLAETATSRGAALAQACITCHGPAGRSQGAIPALTPRPAADLVMALHEFRRDARPSTVMHRIVRGLDDADILAVAAYFAALPAP